MARGDLTTEAAGTADAAGRLAFLDGWRAIAVVLVIQSHLIGFRSELAFIKLIGRWMPAGQIGVLIFFFISGLVITRAALAEIEATAGFSLRAFYIRRAFRIIPPLAFYLAVCVLLGAFGLVDFGIGNALPALLYVCNIGPLNTCLWLGGHTWSLAFEEQFYLLFPILLSVFVLHRRPVILHAVIVVLICLAPLVFPVSYIGWFSFTLSYALFVAGCLAARYGRQVAAVLGRYPAVWFLAATALILVTPFTLSTPILNDYYPLSFIVTIPVMVMSSGGAGGGGGPRPAGAGQPRPGLCRPHFLFGLSLAGAGDQRPVPQAESGPGTARPRRRVPHQRRAVRSDGKAADHPRATAV